VAMGRRTGSFLVVWATMLITKSLGHKLSTKAPITRLNYEVIIRPLQNIRLLTVKDEWPHVFITPLPDSQNFTDRYVDIQVNCSLNTNASCVASCKSVLPLLQSLRMLHASSCNKIRSTVQHIYELFIIII